MKCIKITNPGPQSQLVVVEEPTPHYNENQILVAVKATAVNRADLLQRMGSYPPPSGESDTPGLEVAGEVVAIGSHVKQFKIGDRIYGLTASGGYAEFCPVEECLAQKIPQDWGYNTAAGLPEALTTVYATLFDIGYLKAGQTLLIHGAGSGIASLGIQLAKIIGASVITTVGSQEKIKPALALGADIVINYKEQVFQEHIKPDSVDLIIDFIGGDYFNKHLELLKPQGRLVQIACLKGGRVECHLPIIMRKRLHIIGFVLRSQSLEEKSLLWKNAHEHWFDQIKNKQLKPVIDSVFALEAVSQAHDKMKRSAHFGKIILKI